MCKNIISFHALQLLPMTMRSFLYIMCYEMLDILIHLIILLFALNKNAEEHISLYQIKIMLQSCICCDAKYCEMKRIKTE